MAATKRSKKAEAFREGIGKVFLKYRQEIHKAAYGVTGNREDARDVLQNIFAKLIRGWPPPRTSSRTREGICTRRRSTQPGISCDPENPSG